MSLNDWQIVMYMYSYAIGDNNAETTLPASCFIFFVSFIFLTQYMILNILIAFIIDAYSQLQEMIDLENAVKIREQADEEKKKEEKEFELMTPE